MAASTVVLVLAAIAANTLASILLKHLALFSNDSMLSLWAPKPLLLGGGALGFYAVAFIVYAMVLRTLPVSKAYTLITFGAQIVLIAAGALFFGERYGPMAWMGLALVAVGLVLVAKSVAT